VGQAHLFLCTCISSSFLLPPSSAPFSLNPQRHTTPLLSVTPPAQDPARLHASPHSSLAEVALPHQARAASLINTNAVRFLPLRFLSFLSLALIRARYKHRTRLSFVASRLTPISSLPDPTTFSLLSPVLESCCAVLTVKRPRCAPLQHLSIDYICGFSDTLSFPFVYAPVNHS